MQLLLDCEILCHDKIKIIEKQKINHGFVKLKLLRIKYDNYFSLFHASIPR